MKTEFDIDDHVFFVYPDPLDGRCEVRSGVILGIKVGPWHTTYTVKDDFYVFTTTDTVAKTKRLLAAKLFGEELFI